ncbi:MAG TPA: 30S ribosome-binding factor RbfA [Thermomicrobiales bacterium]|nr:30S ribosome-binding factor RbfA [Thermomicrobiales bacterium]
MTRRTRQVGEMLRDEIDDIIRREMDDPRLGFWSITRVDVPPDLRSARVYISVLGTDTEREETLAAMNAGAGFIRRHLKPRLRMRQIPDLEFRDDRSLEYAATISKTLHDLEMAEQANGEVAGSSEPDL